MPGVSQAGGTLLPGVHGAPAASMSRSSPASSSSSSDLSAAATSSNPSRAIARLARCVAVGSWRVPQCPPATCPMRPMIEGTLGSLRRRGAGSPWSSVGEDGQAALDLLEALVEFGARLRGLVEGGAHVAETVARPGDLGGGAPGTALQLGGLGREGRRDGEIGRHVDVGHGFDGEGLGVAELLPRRSSVISAISTV